MTNVDAALAFVSDGMSIGLGSGRAATRFVAALGDRVRAGLKIRGVPTSTATAALAARSGVPILEAWDGSPIDLTVDGADEVDPALNLIKGFGNALVREKIVAAASRKLVILIGPEDAASKTVDILGRRGKLPVEVVPFALPWVTRQIAELGYAAEPVRDATGQRFVSDNGNPIVHVRVGSIADPDGLDAKLRAIPGVVGTGLFVGMADVVLIENGSRVERRERRGM